jgi:hypothetical protein
MLSRLFRRMIPVQQSVLISGILSLCSGGIITNACKMGVEGTYGFSDAPSGKGSIILWSVDRHTRPQPQNDTFATPSAWSVSVNHNSASGSSVSFRLLKVVGMETVYKIIARNNGVNDTASIQVFSADSTAGFWYSSAGNPDVYVYIITPGSLSPSSHLLSVHHGNGREAAPYISHFSSWGPQNDYVVVAPWFDRNRWTNPQYNLGNVFGDSEGSGALLPKSRWTYTIANDIAVKVLADFGLRDTTYDLWGHSAGGQFVHRRMAFRPDDPIRLALPANSGWYTVPDLAVNFPYGLKSSKLAFTSTDLADWSEKNMVIFRGTADTLIDADVRTTTEANAQGRNRFERAAYMFQAGSKLNQNSRWDLFDVIGSGHSAGSMAPAAQMYLGSFPRSGRPVTGYRNKFSSRTSNSGRRAVQVPVFVSGVITSLSMYHDGGNGQMLLAVYADGDHVPGKKLGTTAPTAVSATTGWQTIDMIKPVTVTAKTKIWLAWVYENNPGIYYQSGTPGRVDAGAGWSGGMPETWGSISTQESSIYAIYATYAESSAVAIRPDIGFNNRNNGPVVNDRSLPGTDFHRPNVLAGVYDVTGRLVRAKNPDCRRVTKKPVLLFNNPGRYNPHLQGGFYILLIDGEYSD